jgi:hypothetical protein
MTGPRLNRFDEKIMASYAVNDSSLPDGFDSSLTYYQWLCRRKPYPMGRDPWYVIGLWITVILVVSYILLGEPHGTGILGMIATAAVTLSYFSIIVGAPIFTLVAFFGWMPRTFKTDVNSGVIRKLFQASNSSVSILSGLRTWACRMNLRHIVPVVVILFTAPLYYKGIVDPLPQDFYWIGSSVMFLVVAAMIWLLLLETGLALSVALPKTGCGGNFMVWAIFVLLVAFKGGNYLAGETQYYVVPHIRSLVSNTDLQQMWFCLSYSVLIGLGTLLPHFQAPKLLDNWKTVLLRESGKSAPLTD